MRFREGRMVADGSGIFHSNNWFNLNEIEGYMSETAVVLMKSHYCKFVWPL